MDLIRLYLKQPQREVIGGNSKREIESWAMPINVLSHNNRLEQMLHNDLGEREGNSIGREKLGFGQCIKAFIIADSTISKLRSHIAALRRMFL